MIPEIDRFHVSTNKKGPYLEKVRTAMQDTLLSIKETHVLVEEKEGNVTRWYFEEKHG